MLYFHTRWLLPAPSLEDHGDCKTATGLVSRAPWLSQPAEKLQSHNGEAHGLARWSVSSDTEGGPQAQGHGAAGDAGWPGAENGLEAGH